MSTPVLQRGRGNIDRHDVWRLAEELANIVNAGLPVHMLAGPVGDFPHELVTLHVEVGELSFQSSIASGLRTTVARIDFLVEDAGPEWIHRGFDSSDYAEMGDGPVSLSVGVDAVVALVEGMPGNGALAWLWEPGGWLGIDLGLCVSANTSEHDSATTGLPVVSAVITFAGLTE